MYRVNEMNCTYISGCRSENYCRAQGRCADHNTKCYCGYYDANVCEKSCLGAPEDELEPDSED